MRCNSVTEHCDIAPTLVEMMHGVAPPGWDGMSLLPFVRHGASPPNLRWRKIIRVIRRSISKLFKLVQG